MANADDGSHPRYWMVERYTARRGMFSRLGWSPLRSAVDDLVEVEIWRTEILNQGFYG